MNTFLLRFQEPIETTHPLQRKTVWHNLNGKNHFSVKTVTAGTKTLTEVRAETADADYNPSLFLAHPCISY
jgi:hypothetical protein